MAIFQAMPWSGGELLMHQKMRVPSDLDNPSVPMLSQQAARTLQQASLLAVGTVDANLQPWTTIWGGDSGFARSLGQSIVGVRTSVAARHDPVVESLVGTRADGEIVRSEGAGTMVSGLTIDLATRKRVKLYGRTIAGALSADDSGTDTNPGHGAEIQLVIKVEQSLGNCPKYISTKALSPAAAEAELLSGSPVLSTEALSLVARADMFFISSRHEMTDMDTNHRGGPAGFVRTLSGKTSTSLVWPEYSGNRLYQTLGNLQVTPLAGLCFPDYATGDVLYLTGTTEVLIGADAANLLPRSNLAVKLTVTAARHVAKGLPFRGVPREPSPYNPKVRYLKTEHGSTFAGPEHSLNRAELLEQVPLTPSISRFHFRLSSPARYTAGQYVMLDFSSHLDIGYSHMRDDDPLSINDDFTRTFTVSNPPGTPQGPFQAPEDGKFEITIRKVGRATELMFKHGLKGTHRTSDFELDVKGFDGHFTITQDTGEAIGFVAAGVGITPLLSALTTLDPDRLVVFWAVRQEDIGLVTDSLTQYPRYAKSFRIFISGMPDGEDGSGELGLRDGGATVVPRRLAGKDVSDFEHVQKWYLCTSKPMREIVLGWLPGKEVIYEDFDY